MAIKTTFVFIVLLFAVKSFSQPVITGFTPASGPIATSVTITGTNFSTTPANNIVYFGPVRATVSSATANSLSVSVPYGTTLQPITVTSGGLTASSQAGFNVTYAGGVLNSFIASSFSNKTEFGNSGGYYIATADIDGDSKPDILRGSFNGVWIFRNTSSGNTISFAAPVTVNAGTGLELGDLDGDGKLDIVSPNQFSNVIGVALNTSTPGNISFANPINYISPFFCRTAAVRDFNGDGKPDFAAVSFSNNSVTIFKNTSTIGNLSFTTGTTVAIGSSATNISASDIDNDGLTDFAISFETTGLISVFRNTSSAGGFSFASAINFAIGSGSYKVILNDLDDDGKPDLCAVNSTGSAVSVLKNTSSVGAVSFDGFVNFTTGLNPYGVTCGDLNGDNKPDLAIANYNSNTISVLKNTSVGGVISFADKTDYTTGINPTAACNVDLDADSKPDLLTVNLQNTSFSVLRNRVNEPFISSFNPIVGLTGTLITISGFNFTGTTAVNFGGAPASSFTIVNDNSITATVGAGASGNVTVTNVYASGTLAGFQYQAQLPPVINSFSPVAASSGSTITISGSNFNATAANNVVYFGAVKANVTAASGNSLTVASPQEATYSPITITSNNLTAYSGLPFHATFTGVVNAFTPSSFSEPLPFATDFGLQDIAIGDIDGDGKSDAIVSGTQLASDRILIYRNTSSGGLISFAPPVDIAPLAGHPYNNIFLGDLDGDGKLDVAAASTTHITLIKNNSSPGTISFAPVVQYSNAGIPHEISIADIDGDGKPDVCITVPGTGTGNIVSVYRNTSSGNTISMASKVDFTVGTNPRGIITNDFDNDGKTDLATINADAATITIMRNTSVAGTVSFAAGTTLSANDNSWKLAAGDFDDDGKLDIAATNTGVYPAYNNTVCVFRNTSTVGTISFAPKINLVAGTSTNDVAVSDLDGDGKAELVVSNHYSSTISVFKNTSTAGSIAFAGSIAYPAGSTPTNFAIGDWDGDGYPEITYSNYSMGFIILRSQVNIPATSLVPPVITSLSPASGNINSSMTINGNNFSATPANNIVYLGSVKATVTAATTTSLNVTVPMAASYKPVTVSRDKLSASSHKPFNVTFADGGAPFTGNFFKSKVDLSTTGGPSGMASSDFDGDGKPDIVVSNGNVIIVYRNIGSGSSPAFAAGINFPAGTSPGSVFTADINGDSKQDLVVTSFGMCVLINTSTGAGNISFAAPQSLSAGGCNDIAIGDLDADGRPDIAYTYTSGSGVTVLRNLSNNGTISFAHISDHITQNGECHVSMGDVTGDSKPDLIVTNHGSNSVSVLRNLSSTGSISFSPAVNFSVNNPTEGTLADIDNDGKLDMLILSSSVNSNTVSVFRNTSSGTISFASKVDFATGKSPVNISISDLNGDTKPDVAIINRSDSSVSALKNTSITGTISFENKYDYSVGMEPLGIVTEDWNADSVVDIATVNFISNTISILVNNHNSPVISSINPAAGTVGTTVTITGFNFVGVTSVKFGGTNAASFTVVSPNSITAVTGEGSNGTVTVTTPLGTGSYESFSFAPPIITSFTPLSAGVGATVTISGKNFSAVAANNIVYFGAVRGTVTASTTTSITATVPAGASYNPITVTTHNMTAYSPKLFSLAFSTAPGPLTSSSFGTKIDLTTAGYSPSNCVVKDFDGDGKPDMIAASGPDDTITIFRNTTTGSTLSFSRSVITGSFAGLSFANTADFDGDGKPDLVVSDYGLSDFYVFRNISTIGNIIFAPAIFINSIGYDPNCIAIDDIDGDGKPDLAVSHSFGEFVVIRNTSMVGNISFANPIIVATSANPVYVALADIDNDGKPEMITSNNINLSVSILRNTSTPGNISFVVAASVAMGGFPWALAVGDLNDDGKLDIAVTNNRIGFPSSITILQNTSSGGNISVDKVADLAIDGYYGVAIGDVNGDKKQDLMAGGYTGSSFVSVFMNIGTGGSMAFDARINYATDSGPGYVTTGDVNMDGKTDIITANRHGGLGGSLTILLNQMAIVTGIPNITLSDLKLQVTPNPFNESITIKAGKTLQNVHLQLVDMNGRSVFSEFRRIIQNGEVFQIRTPKLSPAMYALKISTEKGQSSMKLIKH